MAFDMFDRKEVDPAASLPDHSREADPFIEMPEEMRQAAVLNQHRQGKPGTREGIMARGMPSPPALENQGYGTVVAEEVH